MSACSGTDSNGRRLLLSGSWNSGTNLTVQGGQGMHFVVSNANALGTTISISANNGETKQGIILPFGSIDLEFSVFGNEPMGWSFAISTNSDAFIVTWCLYSTWIPGDPKNPPIAPSVRSVSPNGAAVGATVTVNGSDFEGVTAVNFDTTPAVIQSSTDSQITVTVPQESGTVDVTVVTSSGTSTTNPADQFTYFPIPVVSSISPTSGTSGTTVTIMGSGLQGVTDVNFGVSNVDVVSATDTQIVVNAPDGSGTVDITVTTPGGTSVVSPADHFTYLVLPVVTGVNPNSGNEGDTITVSGSGFTGVTGVGFGQTGASVQSATDDTIVVTVPAGSGTVDITVITPSGTSATGPSDQFTYQPAP